MRKKTLSLLLCLAMCLSLLPTAAFATESLPDGALQLDSPIHGSPFIGSEVKAGADYDDTLMELYFDEILQCTTQGWPGEWYFKGVNSSVEELMSPTSYDECDISLTITPDMAGGTLRAKFSDAEGHVYYTPPMTIYTVEEHVTANGMTFTITKGDNGYEATLTGGDFSGAVTIPDTVTSNGVAIPVTKIQQDMFMGNQNITSLTMPDTVTEIGANVFSGCENLERLHLSDSLGTQNLDINTFAGCNNLREVNIPTSWTTIPASLFAGKAALTSITIPASITSIGYRAFYNTGLLNGTIIYGGTFQEWNALTADAQSNGNGVLIGAKKIFGVTSYVNIENVQAPVEGKTVSENLADICPTEGSHSSVESLVWHDVTIGRDLSLSDTFTGGHAYRLKIVLTAMDGFSYSDDPTCDFNSRSSLVDTSSVTATSTQSSHSQSSWDMQPTHPCGAKET